MKRFKTVHYTIHSNKIKDARGIRFAVIADLHGMEFGPDNRKLLETIHRYRPDGILIAGDMIVRNDSCFFKDCIISSEEPCSAVSGLLCIGKP